MIIGLLILILFHVTGLLPSAVQLASKKINKCYGYKKLNHYYDEKTIKYRRLPINVD